MPPNFVCPRGFKFTAPIPKQAVSTKSEYPSSAGTLNRKQQLKILQRPESGFTRAVLGTKTKSSSAPRSLQPSIKKAPNSTSTKILDLVNNLPLDSPLLPELTDHSTQVVELAEKGVILKKTKSACAGTRWQRHSPESLAAAVPVNCKFISEKELQKKAFSPVRPAKVHKKGQSTKHLIKTITSFNQKRAAPFRAFIGSGPDAEEFEHPQFGPFARADPEQEYSAEYLNTL